MQLDRTMIQFSLNRSGLLIPLMLQLTKFLLEQSLNLSLSFPSFPDSNNGYAKSKFSYKRTDHRLVDGGFNLFRGEDDQTFRGWFQDNSNRHTGLYYSF